MGKEWEWNAFLLPKTGMKWNAFPNYGQGMGMECIPIFGGMLTALLI